jgi:hypothetical protein
MDAYLASRELSQASHFYLNVNFELLNGCKFKCKGCFVEKNAQMPVNEDQFKNFEKLFKDLEGSLYKPFIAFIGPVDFLASTNFVETFSNPNCMKLFKRFKRISLQTTYLDLAQADAIAETLNTHFLDHELEINIVVDPSKIMDDRYLAVLQKNKETFLSKLKIEGVRSFGIMNVYDYDQTKIAEQLRDYDFMHKRVQHLFETTIDYNFSFGRSKDISDEEFMELSDRIKRLFDSSLCSDEKSQYLRFSFGKLTDSLIERQYNFRDGKLYYSPLLYERFVSFRDGFEVPLKDFTASELEAFEMSVQMNQYSKATDKEECEDCPFLASCIDRGILYLMDTFNTKKCLVAKKALFAVNTMGSLPIAEYGNH